MYEIKKCPLGIEMVADQLVEKIRGIELPQDFIPGDLYYDEILANIRHQYTNYEELLWEMEETANCIEYLSKGNICPSDESEDGLECEPKIFAHDTLKWAAKAEAEYLYKQWCERYR